MTLRLRFSGTRLVFTTEFFGKLLEKFTNEIRPNYFEALFRR
jgi:hypothetical protein